MPKSYITYEEIPTPIRDYVLTVSAEECIMNIPLEDINVFLDDLEEFYARKVAEEYEDGWVM